MKIIIKEKNFKVEFNGSTTYFVTDSNGDVRDRVDTLRKAKNSLKRIASNY